MKLISDNMVLKIFIDAFNLFINLLKDVERENNDGVCNKFVKHEALMDQKEEQKIKQISQSFHHLQNIYHNLCQFQTLQHKKTLRICRIFIFTILFGLQKLFPLNEPQLEY